MYSLIIRINSNDFPSADNHLEDGGTSEERKIEHKGKAYLLRKGVVKI